MSGVNLLQLHEDGDKFWLHSDGTHWLLGLHDNQISVVTQTSDALSFERSVGGGVRVGVRWDEEGSFVRMVRGEEGEEEIGEGVKLMERGRPVEVLDQFMLRKSLLTHV